MSRAFANIARLPRFRSLHDGPGKQRRRLCSLDKSIGMLAQKLRSVGEERVPLNL